MKYISTSELHPDPRNREVFSPLSQEELDYLAASIEDHGLINPITITPENLIIAGEQRWRAAQQLKLAEVPVIIRTPKDDLEIEELRLAENLARRNLPPWTMARALERMAKIRMLRAKDRNYLLSQAQLNEELGKTTGRSAARTKQLRGIVSLIPELGELLDKYKFSFEVGAQLAQLPETDQRYILRKLGEQQLAEIDEQEMASLKKQLKESRKAADKWRELAEKRDQTIEETARKIADAKLAEAKREAEQRVQEVEETLERYKKDFEKYQQEHTDQEKEMRRWPVYRFLLRASTFLQLDPDETADKVWMPIPRLAEEIATNAIAVGPWLQRFGKRLQTRVREVKGTMLKEVR